MEAFNDLQSIEKSFNSTDYTEKIRSILIDYPAFLSTLSASLLTGHSAYTSSSHEKGINDLSLNSSAVSSVPASIVGAKHSQTDSHTSSTTVVLSESSVLCSAVLKLIDILLSSSLSSSSSSSVALQSNDSSIKGLVAKVLLNWLSKYGNNPQLMECLALVSDEIVHRLLTFVQVLSTGHSSSSSSSVAKTNNLLDCDISVARNCMNLLAYFAPLTLKSSSGNDINLKGQLTHLYSQTLILSMAAPMVDNQVSAGQDNLLFLLDDPLGRAAFSCCKRILCVNIPCSASSSYSAACSAVFMEGLIIQRLSTIQRLSGPTTSLHSHVLSLCRLLRLAGFIGSSWNSCKNAYDLLNSILKSNPHLSSLLIIAMARLTNRIPDILMTDFWNTWLSMAQQEKKDITHNLKMALLYSVWITRNNSIDDNLRQSAMGVIASWMEKCKSSSASEHRILYSRCLLICSLLKGTEDAMEEVKEGNPGNPRDATNSSCSSLVISSVPEILLKCPSVLLTLLSMTSDRIDTLKTHCLQVLFDSNPFNSFKITLLSAMLRKWSKDVQLMGDLMVGLMGKGMVGLAVRVLLCLSDEARNSLISVLSEWFNKSVETRIEDRESDCLHGDSSANVNTDNSSLLVRESIKSILTRGNDEHSLFLQSLLLQPYSNLSLFNALSACSSTYRLRLLRLSLLAMLSSHKADNSTLILHLIDALRNDLQGQSKYSLYFEYLQNLIVVFQSKECSTAALNIQSNESSTAVLNSNRLYDACNCLRQLIGKTEGNGAAAAERQCLVRRLVFCKAVAAIEDHSLVKALLSMECYMA